MKCHFAGLSLLIFTLVGLVPPTLAEQYVDVSIGNDVVYQIDLDNRQQYYSAVGWRHIIFRISTKGNRNWYRAVAACSPYDLNVPAFRWSWDPLGYQSETVGGQIARAACHW
jgi:hypothetical protein